MNQLDRLKQFTTVVADTGDFHQLAQFAPQDATTNPSLILKAATQPQYRELVREVLQAYPAASVAERMDRIVVRFAAEILKVIPGRVSMEVDARLAFDRPGSVSRALAMVGYAREAGLPTERLLIKLASTWEGIAAAQELERQGLHCNLTLMFSFCQAVACADARVTLVSPFVGRIYDWYKKSAGAAWVEAEHAGPSDPGVESVTRIYRYYKKFGITTQVMGASFRNLGQILALSGCDLLTISPDLLGRLAASEEDFPRRLNPGAAGEADLVRVHFDEPAFRFALNEDAMATEKLAEGIRAFAADAFKLEALMASVDGAAQ